MRRLITAIGFALLGPAVALGVGCTLLISFDDKPGRDAGMPDRTTSPVDTSSGTSSGTSNGGFVPPPTVIDAQPPNPCVGSVDLAKIRGCAIFDENALICADNDSISSYPSPTTIRQDLITCRTTGATCVERCPTACAHLPNKFPDQCDRCAGKSDGTYCGSELGWDKRTNVVLVRCVDGRLSTAPAPVVCGTQCQTGTPAGTAQCDP